MNRFDRVTAILIQLQSKRVVKAQEMADRFHVSLRTIYRDIRSLEEAGVPLYGEAGIGYSMTDGYKLPPVMFSKEEAIALLTAEKLIEKLADKETGNNYAAAMFKIRSVLKTQEKDFLEEVEDRIIVRRRIDTFTGQDHLSLLPGILESIAKKKVLSLRYFSLYKQEQTQRDIEPLGVLFEHNNWHLIAYCRMRQSYRDFRIDRIKGLKVTEETYVDQHPTLADYLEKISVEQNLQKVVIAIHRDAARYISQDKYYYGFVMETDNGETLEMTFLTQSLEGFARWMLMFGDQAMVIDPPGLRKRVELLASEVLSQYQHASRDLRKSPA